MSNINIKSDMGGGNPLNIIRIPSLNEMKNIIFSSDLNGKIAPSSHSVWNWSDYLYRQSQYNSADYSYSLEITISVTQRWIYKNETTRERYVISTFSPIIECIE